MKRPLKICFISLNSYPLFRTNHPGYFGGAELQMSLIAKKLAQDKRFNISVIVADYEQKAVVKTDNITLYLAFRKHRSLFWETIRFFWLLKKINTDVYIERIMNIKVGLVAAFCQVFKKKFIYMLAHDWDCLPDCGGYLRWFDCRLFQLGLKKADLIITQTLEQQKRLKKNLGLNSLVMRSLAANLSGSRAVTRHWLLWVGRADWWKQPEIFIRLAKILPQEKFVMVCRRGTDNRFFTKIKRRAKTLPNLKFFESVSVNKIISYYRWAKILINTSVAEGFPNTFLQSGASQTPILSLKVNPDNFISRYRCGLVCNNSRKKLLLQLNLLLTQPALARQLGCNLCRYVTRRHSLKNIAIFKQLILHELN